MASIMRFLARRSKTFRGVVTVAALYAATLGVWFVATLAVLGAAQIGPLYAVYAVMVVVLLLVLVVAPRLTSLPEPLPESSAGEAVTPLPSFRPRKEEMDKTYWIPEGDGAQREGAQVETLLRLLGDDLYIESLKAEGLMEPLSRVTNLKVDGGELTYIDRRASTPRSR